MEEDEDIIARVRAVREARAARFNYDLDAIFADLRARQGKDGRVVLSPPDPYPAVDEPIPPAPPPPVAKAG